MRSNEGILPLEPIRREELEMAFEQRREKCDRREMKVHRGRRDWDGEMEYERREAEIFRERREYEGGREHERRREDQGVWAGPITWERGGYGGNRAYGGDTKMRKLKIPAFEDDNMDDWIHRVEQYFTANGLVEEERLMVASLCLKGKALSWHKYTDRREPVRI